MGRGWQPISTVPRGDDVLVYCPDAREPQIAIAALLMFDDGEGGVEEWHDVWLESNLAVEPTLWMPLPEKPEKDEATSGFAGGGEGRRKAGRLVSHSEAIARSHGEAL